MISLLNAISPERNMEELIKPIFRARENMQRPGKKKKEIYFCNKRDFAQNCRFYAKRRDFLQMKRDVVQKSTWMHNF